MYRTALALALIVLTLGALAACAPAAPTTAPSTAAAPPLISSPQATTETMPTTVAPTSGAVTTPAGGDTTPASGATTPAAAATTSGTGAAPTEAATSAATTAATAAATSAPATGGQTITVKGTEFKFDPTQITLKVGQPVTIVFTNAGSVDHELEVENIPASNVTLDLSKAGKIPEDEADEAKGDAANNEVHAYAAAGGTATVTFTPTKAGTYNFACNLPGHKEAGMVGTITVQ